MRQFYVRRKDLSAFPFQFTVDRQGLQQRLPKGHTFTFHVQPPKDDIEFLHVHILADFAEEIERRWDIPEYDLIRLAAKGFEAWLIGVSVPDDHFNGIDMLLIDDAWYPHDAAGKPELIAYPYDFMVRTEEPWPTDQWWPAETWADEPQAPVAGSQAG